MGLLDEAIREHLDLKRRRGADPTEVERDEREALGPVRRAPGAPPSATAGEDTESSPFAYDQEDDWSDEPLTEVAPSRAGRGRPEPEPDLDFDDEPVYEDEDEPPPEPRPSRLARIFGKPDPGPHAEREPEDEPEYDDEVESEPPHGAAGEATTEYRAEEAHEHDREHVEPKADEDVLEETPEFLQDTPDHDRLWFEQRPPKDFDFDR
jgi:hypothetical protein